MQKDGTRALGHEAGEEGRNSLAMLLLKNFFQVALTSEIILNSVLMVKSPEADHFFFLYENMVRASKAQI